MNKLIIALALAGWALFGYSVLASRSSQSDGPAEISRLRQLIETTGAERDKLAGTLEQYRRKKEDLQYLQKQIAAATRELKHLEYLRARVSGEIDAAGARFAPPAGPTNATRGINQADASEAQPPNPTSRAAPPSENPVPIALVASPPSRDQVRAAQEALTALGYGELKADGVFGPSTRGAIEAFERSKGLPITGSLGAGTLQALKASHQSLMP